MDVLSISDFLWLWLAGLLAGFVDAIAGGGGIISLPALLATGMAAAPGFRDQQDAGYLRKPDCRVELQP